MKLKWNIYPQKIKIWTRQRKENFDSDVAKHIFNFHSSLIYTQKESFLYYPVRKKEGFCGYLSWKRITDTKLSQNKSRHHDDVGLCCKCDDGTNGLGMRMMIWRIDFNLVHCRQPWAVLIFLSDDIDLSSSSLSSRSSDCTFSIQKII